MNLLSFAWILAFLGAVSGGSGDVAGKPISPADGVIKLFNGENLDGLTTWLEDAKHEDSRGVLSVTDGMLHISGDGMGYIRTNESYRDYHLIIEFKWGKRTWAPRKRRAKDSGVLVHCIGPDGGFRGRFMAGIEAQIIQGGVGDFIVCDGIDTDGSKISVSLTAEITRDRDGERVWKPGGMKKTVGRGRINWYGRDPDWKDVLGFRGKDDVESPDGKWCRMDVICRGSHITNMVNGVTVNEGFDAAPSAGIILIQTEMAEIFIRRWELWPLDKAPAYKGKKAKEIGACVSEPVAIDLRGKIREYPIFTTGPQWHSGGGGYFPVMCKLKNGDLACAFRTGRQHKARPGGQLSLAISTDQGKTWSKPMVIVDGGSNDFRSPSLGQAANGDLVLAFGILCMDSRGKFQKEGGARVTRSSDRGKTWSEPEEIVYHGKGQTRIAEEKYPRPHGQMRGLADGTMVFNARAAFFREPGWTDRETYLFWSKDNGKTWSDFTLMRPHRSETGFLPLSETEWVGFSRYGKAKAPNTPGYKWVDRGPLLIWSHDGGKTWPDQLEWAASPNPKHSMMRHPGSIVKLPGNRVLITYSHRNEPFGVRAILSRDGGKTFDLTREYILSSAFGNPDCGYPSTVALDDGTVVTATYTVIHKDHPEWGVCAVALVYPADAFDVDP